MFDFYKYINFIDGTLASVKLTDEKRDELMRMRDSVTARYNDPTLYLSMLSDFSAGKSTMINRLIGRKLLRTANLATTSVPTYIRNHSESETVISVRTNDGENLRLSDPDERLRAQELLGLTLPQDDSHAIALLTTDELKDKHGVTTLDETVADVTVTLPYTSDIGNLCIIDTPGVNPGTDSASAHAGRTLDILENVADSAIILFPAHQNYSHMFQTFLETYALQFLKDAVFVVTMMDLVDEEEREEVIADVEAKLKEHFGLDNVKLLSCAAGRVGRDESWTEQFEDFKAQLFRHLQEKREQYINRTLSVLLQKLLDEINAGIVAENRDLEEKLAILAQNSVPNLNSVLDRDIARGGKELYSEHQKARSAVNAETEQLADRIMARVNGKLNGFNKRSQITAYSKNELQSDVEAECEVIAKKLAEGMRGFDKVLTDCSRNMTKTLMEYYGKIERLTDASSGTEVADSLALVNAELADNLSGISVNISGGVEIASAAVGAGLVAVVFAALGPVGWIAGAIVGLFGSDYLYVEKARGQIRDGLGEKLPQITRKIKDEALLEVDRGVQNCSLSMAQQRDRLVEQYTRIYQKLTEEMDRRTKTTRGYILQNNFLIRQIDRMNRELNENINRAVIKHGASD